MYDFITRSTSFQSGGKGGFPTTLVVASWKPPSAFLVCLTSRRELKARRAPDLWKGWEQSSRIEPKLDTSLIVTTGACDLPIASLVMLAHKKEDKATSTVTGNTGGERISADQMENGEIRKGRTACFRDHWTEASDQSEVRTESTRTKQEQGAVSSPPTFSSPTTAHPAPAQAAGLSVQVCHRNVECPSLGLGEVSFPG